MTDELHSSLEDVLLASRDPLRCSILALMAWVVACDGEASPEEMEALRQLTKRAGNEPEWEAACEVGRRGEVADVEAGCRMVQRLRPEDRRPFLQAAIAIALADRMLRTPEVHALRFLADVLQLGLAGLHDIFREMTGDDPPSPGDASSIDWWDTREKRSDGESRSHEGPHGKPEEPKREEGYVHGDRDSWGQVAELSRLRALAILGLDESASPQDIREAYRRLAQIHHPDKFASARPEAMEEATITFRRIQAAYERLTRA